MYVFYIIKYMAYGFLRCFWARLKLDWKSATVCLATERANSSLPLPFLHVYKIILDNKYMCGGKCIWKPSSIKPCELSNQDGNRMMNDLSFPINLTQLSPLVCLKIWAWISLIFGDHYITVSLSCVDFFYFFFLGGLACLEHLQV